MLKTYVIHVSDDTKRERHIKSQIKGQDLEVVFITEGDKKDLSKQVLETYFTGNRKNVTNSTSCVYKHILAYEQIVENKEPLALVLEDDIIFYRNFSTYLPKFIAEIYQRDLSQCIVSLEDSMLTYIKRSKRIEGIYLYPQKTGRYAGAYLIDLKGAKAILAMIEQEKCSIPMDWYHDYCSKKERLNIYWAHPTIGVQKSMIGSMSTLIDNKTSGIFKILSFYIQRVYKRLLYNLR